MTPIKIYIDQVNPQQNPLRDDEVIIEGRVDGMFAVVAMGFEEYLKVDEKLQSYDVVTVNAPESTFLACGL